MPSLSHQRSTWLLVSQKPPMPHNSTRTAGAPPEAATGSAMRRLAMSCHGVPMGCPPTVIGLLCPDLGHR